MWFTDCLVTVVSEPPMKQEKYSRGKQEQCSPEKYLDVSILKPMMEVLKVGVNTTTSHTSQNPNSLFGLFVTSCSTTYIDLIVVKAFPQVLEEGFFSHGFEEDHVANPNHVV